MKKFFKILGIIFITFILIIYLCFLFVLPKVVDLNQYKPMLQQIVKEQANLDLDFDKVEITTTPMLSAGVKVDNIFVKYPDGKELLSADSLKTRIALPSLLLYTIKISCLEIENPRITLDIEDGKTLKILYHVDKILSAQEKNVGQAKETQNASPIDISKIRIKIPAAKLFDYYVNANDIKNKHNLKLKGEELIIGYFNGKTAKVKTNASILFDGQTNITANIDIDSFIPEPSKLDEEDDKMQRAEVPYANIVEIYRTYDLKTNADVKLKIRQKNEEYKFNGYANVDDFTLKLANYILPKSYVHLKFNGQKAFANTNLYIKENQNLKLLGFIKFDKNPKMDLHINTDKIYFASFIEFAKGILDTFNVKNDLAYVNTNGYIFANANIKTNLKKLKSDGKIIIRDGMFDNKNTGLNIKNGNADILFEDNTLQVKNAKLEIDNTPLIFEGIVNEKSVADIKVKTKNLPLKGLYKTFAPYNLKQAYSLNSGNLTLDINLNGELKKAILSLKAALNNFSFSDMKKTVSVSNEKAIIDLIYRKEELKASLEDSNFILSLPQTKSVIKNPKLKIDIDNEKISIIPSKLLLNENSKIDYFAVIENWQNKNMKIDFNADGKLNANDLKKFAGKDAEKFIAAHGIIPLKALFNGDSKRQNLTLQLLADSNNYITPVNIASLVGKQSVLQTVIAFKGNRFKVKETGLFERYFVTDEKTGEKVQKLREIIGFEGTIVQHAAEPFINLFTIRIPQDLKVSLNGFKNADFIFGGKTFIYGNTSSPRYRGGFYINDLSISDILMSVKKIGINFEGRHLISNIQELLLNGSDVEINTKIDLAPSKIVTINELNISSKNIDVDKMLKAVEELNKILPPQNNSNKTKQNSSDAEIPLKIEKGNLQVVNLKIGEIKVSDILGQISLMKNTFYLNDLSAKVFEGTISGDIAMNLISNILHIQMQGANIDANKAAVDAAALKDMIFGKLAFSTDLLLNAAAQNMEAQMKSLDGIVDFLIQNGQVGPFGKLENMILAENIRESQFFQTALGGIISNLTTIDTTHFENLNGHIVLKDGIAIIQPITTNGNVLNLYIFGNMDLIKNLIDMKVRVKLGSEISNKLSPIAALNPINLVKATPGLNVAMAKTFSLFSEQISIEEMETIPKFKNKNADLYSTKFQIVLNGDVAKPLKLIKSFKWLATADQMKAAESFVDSLPEPVVTEDGQVLQTAEEIRAYQEYSNKRSTKFKNAVKKIFKKKKKENSKINAEINESDNEQTVSELKE